MKGSVGLLPGLDIRRFVTGPNGILGLLENGLCQMRGSMAQGKPLKLRPHFGHFPDFIQIEESNANPSPWLTDHQTLGLKAAKGFADRHMACAELLGNVILPKLASRLQLTRDNALGQGAADPPHEGVVGYFRGQRCHACEIIYKNP